MRPAPDVAWVIRGEAAYVARLPHGPIVVLDGTAGLIWAAIVSTDDDAALARRVRARLADAPDALPAMLDSFVAELAAGGWLADASTQSTS